MQKMMRDMQINRRDGYKDLLHANLSWAGLGKKDFEKIINLFRKKKIVTLH
jgi:hypothetical protein